MHPQGPLSDTVAPTTLHEEGGQSIPELLHLGEQLARARKAADVSEEDLARRLGLSPLKLKALEEGDHSQLPEGVFVVALARRVAGALNADLEDAIQAVRQSRLMRPAAPPRPSTPTVPPVASTSAAAPVLRADPAPPAPVVSWPVEANAVEANPTASGPRESGSSRWPLAVLAALVAAGGVAAAWRLFSQPSPRSVSTPSTAARPLPASPPPAPVASPVGAESLRLIASEPSWVEVREVNGRTLFEGTLSGEKRFPIGRGIEVIAGRPHAVRASVGPGPATPLGGVTDIRWKRFSAAGSPPASPASAAPTP
jgi:cytoskeleton protein RodZ